MRKIPIGLSVLASAVVAMPATAQSFRPAVVAADRSPLETVWHLRAALNVAALGCRDADETTTIAGYNDLLHRHDAVLGEANDAVSRRYKAQFGAHWEGAREHDMTQLYNFFAQPAAQAAFCATAKQVLAEVAGVAPGDFAAFAATALPRIEAPFWSTPTDRIAEQAPATAVVALSAAVPVGPVAPQ